MVNAKVVIPRKRLVVFRDIEDNMILEFCLAADSDFLISGDKDLLEIDNAILNKELPGLKIITQRTFTNFPSTNLP